MKIFYLSFVFFNCVVYANDKAEAFEKMCKQCKGLLSELELALDINAWKIEEFTPDSCDGILCFY